MCAETAVGKQHLDRHRWFKGGITNSQPRIRRVRSLPAKFSHRRCRIGDAPEDSHFAIRPSAEKTFLAFNDFFLQFYPPIFLYSLIYIITM
jgi:hypothetical protein